MKIYISGPITNNPNYREDFAKAKIKIENDFKGMTEIINPAALSDVLPPSSTHDDFMRVCCELIEMADAVYMLKGWEASKGACIEYGYALAKDLIIIREEDNEEDN